MTKTLSVLPVSLQKIYFAEALGRERARQMTPPRVLLLAPAAAAFRSSKPRQAALNVTVGMY